MFFHQKKTFAFQIVLGAVVLCFALLAVYFVRPSEQARTQNPEAIDASAYRSQAKILLAGYVALDSSASMLDRLAKADEALKELKAMRVPSEDKDAHLKLVIAFEKISQGIRLDEQTARQDGEARLKTVTTDYPWLNP